MLGSEYTGDWLDNQMHGRGQRTFPNGDVYVGAYKHGQRCGGPDCKVKFANGDLYVGSWESNNFHGHGRYFFADGTALEGTFDHGKKQGKFKRQKPSGTLDILRYENDKISGQGVRWNASRTKTWLLKIVTHKKKNLEHRRASDDACRNYSERIHSSHHTLCSSIRSTIERDSTHGMQQMTTDLMYDPPPLAEERATTIITKKSSRISIAQAVSIGYDCELGESLRDTNPAFWSVGNLSKKDSNETPGNNDSDDTFV
jgi:hypothetical protein